MARNAMRTAAAMAAGIVAGLSFLAAPAQASTGRGWRLSEVYGRGAANIDASYPSGLAVPSRHAAWSIWDGCTWPCNSGNTPPVVRHWNGRVWRALPQSQLHGISAGYVAASSADDAWLFGSFAGQRYDGALHWNGRAWSKVAAPSWLIRINGSGLADIYTADFSRNDMWVFSLGGYVAQKTAFVARYENGRWSKSYLPDIPEDAAAISPKDIWVIGEPFTGRQVPVLMHWNGRRWSKSAFPKQRRVGEVSGLIATGPKDMWASWLPLKAGVAPYLLHWNGIRWAKVAFPKTGTGVLAAGDGAGGIWVNGFARGKKRIQLFLHWRAGRWTATRVPQPGWQAGNVDEFALIPGTTSVWATGNVYGPGAGTTLNRGAIWRYN
jgi:hypothetical protein